MSLILNSEQTQEWLRMERVDEAKHDCIWLEGYLEGLELDDDKEAQKCIKRIKKYILHSAPEIEHK